MIDPALRFADTFFFFDPPCFRVLFGFFSHDGGRGHLKKQPSLNMGESVFLHCTTYLVDPAGPVSAVDSKKLSNILFFQKRMKYTRN